MTDRTSDFVKISVLFDSGAKRSMARHRPLSRDARRAQQVADQLRQQELCLRELQELVARKSIIGDDPSAQIATLTDVLKKELAAIERNIQAFQQDMAAQRGHAQQQHQAHFGVVCSSLKTRCAKSAKEFHLALQQHTAAIRERSSRRSKFSHGGSSPMVHINAPLFARTGSSQTNGFSNGAAGLSTRQGSEASAPSKQNPGATGGPQAVLPGQTAPNPYAQPQQAPGDAGGLRRRANLGSTPFMQQQRPMTSGGVGGVTGGGQQATQYFPRQDAQTRYNNAMQVESTIVEITGMYTRMATMVAEQGEIISRIDDDMDIAQSNVEAAQGELLKLFNMVSGNRSLILKIFLVLILVIFLFVVVF